jgi:hypothetical protein
MATTTNYSWTTPDDTALVKDGAAAIRSLGTAIDTTTYNNSLLPIVKTIVDAKGDIIAATAADTVSRLAVGANDTVLTADSTAATGLKWATPAAGGMTLLSTTTLSGATVTISSINQTYKSLVMFIYGVTNATGAGNFQCVVNTANVGSFTRASTNSAFAFAAGANITLSSITANYRPKHTSSLNGWCFRIDNYANTTGYKPIQISGAYRAEDAYGDDMWVNNSGGVVTTSAITQLIFSNTGGNLSTGTVELYGVK